MPATVLRALCEVILFTLHNIPEQEFAIISLTSLKLLKE